MEHIQHWIYHYGYFGILIILLLEMIGIPFPAETTLIVSGFAWQKGVFSLPLLLLFASAGNITGSIIAYIIGRYLGRPVVMRFGKYIGLTNEKFDKMEGKFKKYGNWLVLFSKFIAGIRVLVPYLSGINRMPLTRFTVLNIISAILWTSTFILLGRYIEITWHRYYQSTHQLLLPVIIIASISIGLYFFIKHRRKRPKSTEQLGTKNKI